MATTTEVAEEGRSASGRVEAMGECVTRIANSREKWNDTNCIESLLASTARGYCSRPSQTEERGSDRRGESKRYDRKAKEVLNSA